MHYFQDLILWFTSIYLTFQFDIIIVFTIGMIKANSLFEQIGQEPSAALIRNADVVSIRRDNRENIFLKRRRAEFDEHPQEQLVKNLVIVQPRYHEDIEKFLREIYERGHFDDLALQIKSEDILLKHRGVIGIRLLLNLSDSPPIQEVIDSGTLQQLLQMVGNDEFPQLQFEAGWSIANIAAVGTEKQCKQLSNFLESYMRLLHSQNIDIAEQAIWIIGNLSVDDQKTKKRLINLGVIKSITNIIKDNFENNSILRCSAWCLSILCRGYYLQYQVVKQGIQVLCQMMIAEKLNDEKLFAECCSAISEFCNTNKGQKRLIISTKLLSKLVSFVTENQESQFILPCIRIIGSLSLGGEKQIQLLLDYGVLDVIYKSIFNKKVNIRKDSCWVLSNLACSTLQNVNCMIQRTELIEKLVKMFRSDQQKIKKEIAFIFANMCYSGKELDLDLVYIELGLVNCYKELLESSDVRTIEDTLECLKLILRMSECRKCNRKQSQNVFASNLLKQGVVEILQNLQYHESDSIYEKVKFIIENYYETDESIDHLREVILCETKSKKDPKDEEKEKEG